MLGSSLKLRMHRRLPSFAVPGLGYGNNAFNTLYFKCNTTVIVLLIFLNFKLQFINFLCIMFKIVDMDDVCCFYLLSKLFTRSMLCIHCFKMFRVFSNSHVFKFNFIFAIDNNSLILSTFFLNLGFYLFNTVITV